MVTTKYGDNLVNNRNILLTCQINSSSFHTAMKFSIQLAQIFGCFPIDVGGTTCRNLRVRWLTWRMLYAFITFICFILLTLTTFNEKLRSHLNALTISNIIFNLDGIIKYMLTFKLSLEWPNFVNKWHKIEIRMKNYELCDNLRRTLNVITSLIMLLAAVEHVLITTFQVKKSYDRNGSISAATRDYFVKSFNGMFRVVEYSLWIGVLAEIVNLQMTFIWSYVDVFIMIIGTAIKYKLRQISRKLKLLTKLKVVDINVWKCTRRDYIQLVELCDITNNRISPFIMVSFTVNLYFVIMQLFSSLRPIENLVEKIYFFISFGLLLIRLICVCFFGSGINDEWKNIGNILNSVQSSAYNLEVERFIENVGTYELALSGKNFFKITRGLILKIASVIVTYELVLMQFNIDLLKSKLE